MLPRSRLSRICLLLFLFTSVLLAKYTWMLWAVLIILGAMVAFCAVIWCLFRTLDMLNLYYIKLATNKKDETRKTLSSKMQEEQFRASTFPPYASGWYPLCWSNEVQKGEVIQKNALGKYFAIFRGFESGEIAVLDAHCPHLGANMVVGGAVCGDTLVCPFHLWKFDKNGICKDIPYLKQNAKIPKNANSKCYQCIEYHDMVCVYFDSNGNDKRLPLYNLPVQHQLLDKSKYSFIGSMDYGLINMHIQDFAENAGDWAHFAPIHGKMMIPFTQFKVPIINRWLSIRHSPAMHVGGGHNMDSEAIDKGNYGPNSKYFLYFINKAQLEWKGKLIPNTVGNASITFCGPAGICIFKFVLESYDPTAEIILFHTNLPEDKMNLRVRFHWYASKKLPRLLVWYTVGQWIAQWTNDIAIWENKILLNKPCLVKGDGPINKLRRWYQQFYPKMDNKKIVIQEEQKVNADGGQSKQEMIQREA